MNGLLHRVNKKRKPVFFWAVPLSLPFAKVEVRRGYGLPLSSDSKNLHPVRDFARKSVKPDHGRLPLRGSYSLVAATFRLRFRVGITLEADTQANSALGGTAATS